LDHKHFFLFLTLILLSLSVFALPPALTSTSPTSGQVINGGSTINLGFTMVDYNKVDSNMFPQIVKIYYSTTPGAQTNLIVIDLNVQDRSRITCTDYNFFTAKACAFPWTVPGTDTIPSNTTLYIDYNFGDFNGVSGVYDYRTSSSAGFTIFQPMSSGMCGMMNLIPFALLAGLVIIFITMFFSFKSGTSPVDTLIMGGGAFIVVFIIAIVIYTLIGQVCTV